jgi:Spy/CpxP family protein refolding chaperone
MNIKRLAKPAAVVAGVLFLFVVPGVARTQSAPPGAMQTPKVASRGAQPKENSPPENDFAGLNYTDDQKAEIDKIHREMESNKQKVAKDEKLTEDQKNAMLLGYTRMEYGRIYKVLSPEQQRQVRQRVRARRAADQAAQKKQPRQPSK